MGAQVSKSNVSSQSIIQSISNTIINSISNCSANSTQSQSISLGKVSGSLNISGVNQNTDSKITLSCIQNDSNDTQILNDIKQNLEQQTQAGNSGQNLGVQATNSSDISNSITKILNSLDIQNVKNCLGSAITSQKISSGDVSGNVNITGITQTSAVNIVQNCLEQNVNLVKNINDLTNTLSQKAQSKNSGFLNGITLAIIAFILILILVIYYFFSSSGKNVEESVASGVASGITTGVASGIASGISEKVK